MNNLVFVIFIFLIIVFVAAICAAVVCTPYQIDFKKKQLHLKKSYQDEQKKLFLTVTDSLRKEHIPFWLTQQTLVDATNKKLFAHDEVHIAVMHEYEHTLFQLKEREKRFFLVETLNGYVCSLNNCGDVPCVSIDIMAKHNAEILPCSSRDALGECRHEDSYKRRHEIWLETDIFPLQEIEIDGIILPVPRKFIQCATLYAKYAPLSCTRFLMNQTTKTLVHNALATTRFT